MQHFIIEQAEEPLNKNDHLQGPLGFSTRTWEQGIRIRSRVPSIDVQSVLPRTQTLL